MLRDWKLVQRYFFVYLQPGVNKNWQNLARWGKCFLDLSMYLVFTTNWGHKNNNYLQIRNNNNNVYTIKKYVPFINCIME